MSFELHLSESSLLDNILTPGSSLHPRFLLILDGIFISLLLVLTGLAFMTSGNVHTFVLIGIELALWGSVKWFVNELQSTQRAVKAHIEDTDGKGDKKE